MLEEINKDNFNQALTRFSTSELETLLEKFPYFQQAHLLLAKKYQQQNNPRFDQQLQLAALYTHDRELLYSIFNEQTVTATLPDLSVEKETAEIPVVTETTEVKEAVTTLTETSNNTEPVIELLQQPEEKIIELQVVPDTELVGATTDSAEPLILETTKQPETEPQPLLEVALEPTKKEEPVTLSEFEPEPEKPVIETKALEANAVEEFSTADPHTFDEWLKAYANTETVKVAELKQEPLPLEPEKQDEELEKLILSNIPVNLQELVEEETHYSKGLDRFIEEQIQKHKSVAVKNTANENDLDPELVTETMAKVYEMQKKYARAIKCYETLILKYPEKIDFFAARINYLKNIT